MKFLKKIPPLPRPPLAKYKLEQSFTVLPTPADRRRRKKNGLKVKKEWLQVRPNIFSFAWDYRGPLFVSLTKRLGSSWPLVELNIRHLITQNIKICKAHFRFMIILCPPKKSVQLMLAEERRIFLAKDSKCFCQRKCSISVSNLRSSSFCGICRLSIVCW